MDVDMDSGIPGPTLEPIRDEGMPTATAPMEIPTVPPPAPPPEEHVPEMRGQGVHAKALRISVFVVRNRQNSRMTGVRDSRSKKVTHP